MSWDALREELDLWQRRRRRVELWWRDDDAEQPSAALHRLACIASDHGAPLALAVSPALATEALGRMVADEPGCIVLQHGYRHVNHAPPDRKKCEFGDDRPMADMLEELRMGLERMLALFDGRFLPVMVPPWNRMSPAVLAELNAVGFNGISGYLARVHAVDCGLRRCNTHVDIIDWRGGRRFVGTVSAIDLLVRHLAAKRGGQADPGEPTGLLTHHLCHDTACWTFVEDLLRVTQEHPAARWLAPRDIFG